MEPAFEKRPAKPSIEPHGAPPVTTSSVAEKMETIAEAIANDHHRIGAVVRSSPEWVPALLQFAITSRPQLDAVIRAGMRAEFERTGGVGPTVDRMFMSALALSGPGSAEVRHHVESLVGERDREWQNPADHAMGRVPASLDGKDQLLKMADRDPAAGHLYARFFADPIAAAGQLLVEARTDKDALQRHATLLSGWMRDTKPTARFTEAVLRLDGPGAPLVKEYVAKSLYRSLGHDAAMVKGAAGNFGKTHAHVRVDTLMPLLAQVISQPDVIRAILSVEAGLKEHAVPGMPSMRAFLELVLSNAYSSAAQVDVRMAVSQGGVDLLRKGVDAAEGSAEQLEAMSSAGRFLGTAAAAQEHVGIERAVADQFSQTLTQVALMAPHSAIAPVGIVGKLVGFTVTTPNHVNRNWTADTVGQLLGLVYTAAHPVPKGPPGDPGFDAYSAEYKKWSQTSASEFNAAFLSNK